MAEDIVCVSPNGADSYRASRPATRLAVATTDGAFLLEKMQSAWRVTRQALQGVHLGALLHDCASQTLFAGAHTGGGYASPDLRPSLGVRAKGLGHAQIFPP